MTDREREDVKRHLQLLLALVGGAAVLGSIAGAALGYVSSLRCFCCEEGEGET